MLATRKGHSTARIKSVIPMKKDFLSMNSPVYSLSGNRATAEFCGVGRAR
jgi:hypothetical protein